MSDRNLGRLASDYSQPDTLTPFSASDAISLASFVDEDDENASGSYRHAYYLKAWRATTKALDLPFSDEALRCLRGHRNAQVLEPFFRSLFEPFVFYTVLRARQRIISFIRINAGWIEGDPWGGPMLRREELRPPLEAARGWYDRTSETVLKGLDPIDEALCAMLGWNASQSVPFETLRRDHGWEVPTLDERIEHWL